MKTLIIGGPMQGEWREIASTSRTWVDLLRGETYMIRKFTWAIANKLTGHAGELFKLPIAVHPSIAQHQLAEAAIAEQALYQVIAKLHIDGFMREHAEPQPMADVDVDVEIPDTPAELCPDINPDGTMNKGNTVEGSDG